MLGLAGAARRLLGGSAHGAGAARAVGLVLVTLALASGAEEARAQGRAIDVQLFLPTPTAGTGFALDRPEVPRHLTYVLGLDASVATGLLVRENDGAQVVRLRMQAELLAAIGLFEWLELGVAVPLVVGRVAADPFAAPIDLQTRVSAGDLRLSAKVPILRGDFALSGKIVVTLPTGDGNAYAGAEYWTLVPSVVLAYRTGPVQIGGELGYRFRQRAVMRDGTRIANLEFDDELDVGLAGQIEALDWMSVIVETQFRAGVGGRTIRSNEIPMEARAGLRFRPTTGLTIDVGGGTGILSGYGTPTGRAFVIARYASEREPCEAGPEDFDGFDDGDFCADPDNDTDGILDGDDECRNDPEDVDRFLDEDGCPDVDNDADGVLDAADRCPNESEDFDGYEDADGCPENDNDEDGVLDGVDRCPMEPEDRDRYEDDDGCPEPGPEQAVVTVTDTRILISERIYFDFDTDRIRPVSLPLLDQVAEVMLRLPASRRIRVEGYTDNAGNPQYNLDLSYRRARAVVEYLSGRGVPRARLEYVGYGVQNPVAPNDSIEGRALNRRVEFTILEPGDAGRGRPQPPRRQPR